MHTLFSHEPAGQTRGEPVQSKVPELRDAAMAAVYCSPRMGGDFYDFLRVGPDRMVIGLLDVAGRIEENHAIVSAAQNTFRTLTPELFAAEDVNEADAMTKLCIALNRSILQAQGSIRSCPAFAACYNESLGTVCYFNAGHTPGLFRDGSGITALPATGLPLGLFSHATCESPMIALAPGAALLLVSRGVLEAKNEDEEFGVDRLKDTFLHATSDNPKELSLGIISNVQQFMHTPPTHNDVTVLALIRATTRASAVAG
jgi:sigma-B regulation protein RsbU (phosphoserine phosphatase)